MANDQKGELSQEGTEKDSSLFNRGGRSAVMPGKRAAVVPNDGERDEVDGNSVDV